MPIEFDDGKVCYHTKALGVAARNGSIDILNYLLNTEHVKMTTQTAYLCNNMQEINKYKLLPIHIAAMGYQRDPSNSREEDMEHQQLYVECFIKLLEAKRATVIVLDEKGNNVMHLAVLSRNAKLVEYILENELVDGYATNNQGKRAYDLLEVVKDNLCQRVWDEISFDVDLSTPSNELSEDENTYNLSEHTRQAKLDRRERKQLNQRKIPKNLFLLNYKCPICNQMLLEPMIIKCGHSFCKHCLIDKLKKKAKCPLECPGLVNESDMVVNYAVQAVFQHCV